MSLSLTHLCILRLLLLQLATSFALVDGAALNANNVSTTLTASQSSQSSNGSGLAYAESCQAKLFAWSKASSNYGSEHGHNSTSLYSSHLTVKSVVSATSRASSIIRLCDGYPRVVGRVSSSNGSTITSDYTWTNTNPTFVPASYPTPAPCSINAQDCESLWSSMSAHYDPKATGSHGNVFQNPPCTTRSANQSYSTNSHGGNCDNCQVIGSQIRLLYWPVITKPGSGNLCNKTAETVTAAPTGDGPNVFVTDGITITSPSVAVSIGGVSRVDGCGPTIANTIIPVPPEAVSSVRGARALFTHEPFNFADLNYKCLSDPDKVYVTTANRDDCYQEVPASAYFYGYQNAAGVDWYNANAFANSTIWPNYQPQVLPPQTMMKAIRSVWGTDCNIHPDGVWDPPIALTSANSIPLPKAGPGAPAKYATTTSNVGPAMPAGPVHTQPIKTSQGWGPAIAETQGSLETPTAPSDHHDSATAPAAGVSSTVHASHDDAALPSVVSVSSTVHVVHITTHTTPTPDRPNGTVRPSRASQDPPVYTMEGERFTQIVASSTTLLANGASTITIADGNGIPNAIVQPFRAPHADSGHVVTVQGAEYTVQSNGLGSFRLEGQSTTISLSAAATDPVEAESAATSSHRPLATASSTDSDLSSSEGLHGSSSPAGDQTGSSILTSRGIRESMPHTCLAFVAALTTVVLITVRHGA